MTPPLVTRTTGDIIPASDHNDTKSYIQDGTYRVKTAYLLANPGSAPTPAAGVLYFDTTAGKFKGCNDGSSFVNLVGGGGISGYQATYVVKTGGSVGTDCTHTTIASAVSDAGTSGVKKIYILAGTYDEALTLNSSNYNGLILEGESMEKTIIRRNSGTSTMLAIQESAQNILVRNMTFNSTTGSGIANMISLAPGASAGAKAMFNLHFENLMIYHNGATDTSSPNAFWVYDGSYSGVTTIQGLYITGCQFYNTGAAKTFIWLGGDPYNADCTLYDVHITDNYFSGIPIDVDPADSGNSVVTRGLIQLYSQTWTYGGAPTVKNVVITNNTIYSNNSGTYGTAIHLFTWTKPSVSSASYITNINIRGNVIISAAATNNYGIYSLAQGTNAFSDGFTITANVFRTTAAGQIVNSGATNLVDSGNNKLT